MEILRIHAKRKNRVRRKRGRKRYDIERNPSGKWKREGKNQIFRFLGWKVFGNGPSLARRGRDTLHAMEKKSGFREKDDRVFISLTTFFEYSAWVNFKVMIWNMLKSVAVILFAGFLARAFANFRENEGEHREGKDVSTLILITRRRRYSYIWSVTQSSLPLYAWRVTV